MTGRAASHTVFVTFVDHPEKLPKVNLLVESIRTFGGHLSESYIWIFLDDRWMDSCPGLKGNGTKAIQLHIPEEISQYPFAGKVAACARAEELTENLYKSIVWMAPDCLVVNPPDLFDLDGRADAALRPVHVRNVGSLSTEPPDGYWKGIFKAAGISDLDGTVESFVDCRILRSYYNTHAFAVNPSACLMSNWQNLFSNLVTSRKFQKKQCGDETHMIFLHQATFSTVLASGKIRKRMLPEEYCYPYNFQEMIPADRRAETLNELVCISYENRPLNPDAMTDIVVEEPLRTWLE